VLVESFWRNQVFRVKNQCLSIFANKWLWKVLGEWFWDGWNLNFSVDYDRVKCQERVGENGTEIRLTVWILRKKWWKRKKQKICVVRRARSCVYRYGPCIHSVFFGTAVYVLAPAVRAVRASFFAFFVLFHPFLLWIGLWRKHESFR